MARWGGPAPIRPPSGSRTSCGDGSCCAAGPGACAKSRLVGEHDEPGPAPGDHVPLRHEGKRVGSVVRTRRGVRPVFVSPGHRIGHAAAVRWVLRACRGYRLPEPTRQAHLAANRLRAAAAR